MQTLLGIPHDPPELHTRQQRQDADRAVQETLWDDFQRAFPRREDALLEEIVAPCGPGWATDGYSEEWTRAPKPPCLTTWKIEKMVRDGQRMVVKASITMEFGERGYWPNSWGPRPVQE